MSKTTVTILVLTFKRYDELKDTISALRYHLQTGDLNVNWVVSDDSTPDGRKLSNLKRIKDWQDIHWIVTPERMGWGAHVNWAHRWIADNLPDTDYVFFIEDDYVLQKDLNLATGAALLDAKPGLGMLRYRGTQGTRLVYHQFEAQLADKSRVTYLHFDGGSRTVWLYSNGPHLKRFKTTPDATAFHDFYGDYPEMLLMGNLEEHYAHRVKDMMRHDPHNAPGIAILPEWVLMHFAHIGQSFQHTEHDIVRGQRDD